jgi:hypothetical protein
MFLDFVKRIEQKKENKYSRERPKAAYKDT